MIQNQRFRYHQRRNPRFCPLLKMIKLYQKYSDEIIILLGQGFVFLNSAG